MRKICYITILILSTVMLIPDVCAGQKLIAIKTDEVPVIDGNDIDVVWAKAQAVTIHDKIADIDITLKATYPELISATVRQRRYE